MMGVGVSGIAMRHIQRAEPSAVERLRHRGVATIHEAMGRKGLLKPYIRPIYTGAHACGPAVTVLLHPGDNWMMHVAAEMIQPGDIVVAACTADCSDGFFGDLLATSFRARGAVGLVIDAGVRDVKDLTRMQFPVFSKAVSAKGTIKATVGSVNVPVICAGALVNPGDVVIADSVAIMVYLLRKYAPDTPWFPDDPITASQVQRWLSIAAGELASGPNSARLMAVFGRPGHPDTIGQTSKRLLEFMDAHLKGRTYLVGDGPTIADLACYACVAHAPEGGIDLAPYPSVRAWLKNVEALPHFKPMPASKPKVAA